MVELNISNDLQNAIKKIVLDTFCPVGKVYISVDNVDPSTLFGGTWQAFGQGRCLVGVDTSKSEFNSVLKTGGEKSHTLTVDEMPSHYHTNSPNGFICNTLANGGPGVWSGNSGDNLASSNTTMRTGGNQPHNNLQPYITVYMWKRVA